MALIKPKENQGTKTLQLKVPAALIQEIEEYCKTFQLEGPAYFFIEAAQHVLITDKDWLAKKKAAKKLTQLEPEKEF